LMERERQIAAVEATLYLSVIIVKAVSGLAYLRSICPL